MTKEPEIEVEVLEDNQQPATTEAPEIEVIDDTPDPDKGRPRRPEGADPELPDDEELKQYSAGVQSRIKKLKWEFHEERRAKEDAARQLNAAVDWARRVSEENNRLDSTLTSGEVMLKDQAAGRVKAEKDAARDAYTKAAEAGDTAAMAAAIERLSKASAEERDVDNYQPREHRTAPPPVIPRPAVHDPKLVDWVDKNKWFQRDRHMTNYAMAYEARLQEEEGITPQSDSYYKRIDQAMRKEFPHRFSNEEAPAGNRQQSQRPPVAPAIRPTGSAPNRVTLTQSQVAVAKKIGITPEQYARQILKEQNQRG